MAWGPSDILVGIDPLQATHAATYNDVLIAGISGVDCVLVGGVATAQGSPNMTYSVTKSAVLSNQILKGTAAWTATIGTAHASLPRIDLIVIDASGAGQVRAGTAAAVPLPPARTANDVVLYGVYVPANDTTMTDGTGGNLFPLRVDRTVGPICLYKSTAFVHFDTTATIQTLVTLVIPNGLLVAGRILRVRCGGNYSVASGSPTYTFTVGLTNALWVDATVGVTVDADPGAWQLDFDLAAQTSSAQTLTGRLLFQTPAARVAPTTGIAGDLAVVTHVAAPFAANGTRTADAGDQTLLVQCTMSVSNASNYVEMGFATVELL